MAICGPRCAKYSLYFTNVVIIVLAVVTLGVGIWMSADISQFVTSVNPNADPSRMGIWAVQEAVNRGVGRTQTVANILVTAGVFAMLIGFLGVWAAYRDSKSLLIVYAVVLIVIVLLELGAGIAWSVDKPKIIAGLERDYGAALPLYDYIATIIDSRNRIVAEPNQIYNNITMPATALINMMQTWVGCCGGANGYLDFIGSLYWAKSGGVPPVYCCKMVDTRQLVLEDPNCAIVRTPMNSYMNVGCTVKIRTWITDHSGSVVGTAVGIGLIDFLGIIAAFYQYRCLTHGYPKDF